MHHFLHPGSNRLKNDQPRQVEGCRSQRGHRSSAIAAIAVRVLVELDVPDPVPALNAPADPHQLQQRIWRGSHHGEQASEKQIGGLKGLAVAPAGGRHLHNPAGAGQGLKDVLRRLFGKQRPVDIAAIADLVILCKERDLALSLELAADLAVETLLVALLLRRSLRLQGNEEFRHLLLELPKNGLRVCTLHPRSPHPRDPTRQATAAKPPAMVFAGCVAGLADRHTQSGRIQRDQGN